MGVELALLALALAAPNEPHRSPILGQGLPEAGLPAEPVALPFRQVAVGELARSAFLAWQEEHPPTPHPEPAYRFLADIYAEFAPWVRARPDLIEVLDVGRSVEGQTLWGFRIRSLQGEAQKKILVFANIHALEWVPSEIATAFFLDLVAHPPPGVEVLIIPTLNPDGRAKVEADIEAGRNLYHRGNANLVDLNRDFAVNREAHAIWRFLMPRRYAVSPAPLSQPETQALDALAAAEHFDVTVSLHSFGGFIYTPWAGRWKRPPDWAEHRRLGEVMAAGQGAHAYHVLQLSRWGFFFRGHGMEVDHLYGQYGATSFLIETTRSGLSPFHLGYFKQSFRWYNPTDPSRHEREGLRALRALAWTLSWESQDPVGP